MERYTVVLGGKEAARFVYLSVALDWLAAHWGEAPRCYITDAEQGGAIVLVLDTAGLPGLAALDAAGLEIADELGL